MGGTHLRLAQLGVNGPENIRTYAVKEWPGIDAVLADYAGDMQGRKLILSCGTRLTDGRIMFDQSYKGNHFSFHVEETRAALGLNALDIVHDFRAMAYAVLSPRESVFKTLRDGNANASLARVIMGPGTGIGHAFIWPETGFVQDTHGGHFPPVATTPEQVSLLAMLRGDFDAPRTFIFEDILSGAGLLRLHRAVCRLDGKQAQAQEINQLLDDPAIARTASVFSGFLGLYAHMAVSMVFAYGGIYLSGGVLEKLDEAGLFDHKAFFEGLQQDMVKIVARDLAATPVHIVHNRHTALYGLEVYAAQLSDH